MGVVPPYGSCQRPMRVILIPSKTKHNIESVHFSFSEFWRKLPSSCTRSCTFQHHVLSNHHPEFCETITFTQKCETVLKTTFSLTNFHIPGYIFLWVWEQIVKENSGSLDGRAHR